MFKKPGPPKLRTSHFRRRRIFHVECNWDNVKVTHFKSDHNFTELQSINWCQKILKKNCRKKTRLPSAILFEVTILRKDSCCSTVCFFIPRPRPCHVFSPSRWFFCDPVVLESICYRTTDNRLKYEGKTTWMSVKKIEHVLPSSLAGKSWDMDECCLLHSCPIRLCRFFLCDSALSCRGLFVSKEAK